MLALMPYAEREKILIHELEEAVYAIEATWTSPGVVQVAKFGDKS